jgi:hypothetical protein
VRIFAEHRLSDFLTHRQGIIRQKICARDEQYILNVNEAQFVQYLVDRYRLEALQINFDNVSVSEQKRFIRADDHPVGFSFAFSNGIDRLVFTFHIPVSGTLELLQCRPTTHVMWSEEVPVLAGELQYEIICFWQDEDKIKRRLEEFKRPVLRQLENVNAEVEQYNVGLKKFVGDALTQRREELLKKNSFVASLGVPLKSSQNVPTTFSVPLNTPKKIQATAPKVTTQPFSPEPTMEKQAYTEILQTIHDVGKQFERMPSTYTGKDEESLRDHILLMLEPRFEGSATGETFNKTGKTDILLRHEGNNIFVGECKFWSGKKGFLATIDQILGYLTWRDSKAAVIMFVRNREIVPVLKTIEEETPSHSCFDSFVKCVDESWSEYNFHLPDDSNRSVKLAVLVFHIPSVAGGAV